MPQGLDLRSRLPYTLSNAPLTAPERTQIYNLTNDKTAAVGYIKLAETGERQFLVRGPASSRGNSPVWIFTRHGGALHLVLQTSGHSLIVRGRSHHGYHDVAAAWRRSAVEAVFRVYSWDGNMYTQADCYATRTDPAHPHTDPRISPCP